jgi:hypothetical protein
LRATPPWTSIAAMHRPTRQLKHLLDKIARKESRAKAGEKKLGPRAKLWKKWAEAYKPLSKEE